MVVGRASSSLKKCGSAMKPLSRARPKVAQPNRFPEFLQAPRQPLADALGLVLGVVVVGIWHGGSSPEFVEHELLLRGAQWRAVKDAMKRAVRGVGLMVMFSPPLNG
jgi:hypothetical protein